MLGSRRSGLHWLSVTESRSCTSPALRRAFPARHLEKGHHGYKPQLASSELKNAHHLFSEFSLFSPNYKNGDNELQMTNNYLCGNNIHKENVPRFKM